MLSQDQQSYERNLVLSDPVFPRQGKMFKTDTKMSVDAGVPTDCTTNIIIDFFVKIR